MRKRVDWTTAIWRFLVFCTCMTGLAGALGMLETVPLKVLVLLTFPSMLTLLILVVAGLADRAEEKSP